MVGRNQKKKSWDTFFFSNGEIKRETKRAEKWKMKREKEEMKKVGERNK